LACSVAAQGHDPADKAHYELQTPHRSGWVTTDNGAGEFIYGDQTSDRRRSPAFLIGKVERNDHTFFSAQEEDELWGLVQKKLEAHANRTASVVRKTPTYRWPKVTVDGAQICVPTLDKSDDANWKQHLTCVEIKQ
jgi:hypothetical protein